MSERRSSPGAAGRRGERRAQGDPGLAKAGSLRPGDLLAGRFRIESFLGAGATGEVYEAEDSELGARVALKLLRPEIAEDPELRERFKREIHLARQVTHPNVCRLFDLFRDDAVRGRRAGDAAGRVFVSMELLAGESLADRLDRTGRMTLQEALPLARQMAAALDAAHRARVVHRDFKSANVMLVGNGGGPRAVVTDFGLARADLGGDGAEATTLTQDGSLLGSPAYMAPEQVLGEVASAASDLYAFGVVLYEMVTGHLPFEGGTAFQVALRRVREEPPSPKTFLPDLDPRWEREILACLARDPALRPQSAERVVRALAGEVALDPLPGARTLRRRAGLVATGALLLAALGGLGIWTARQARNEEPVVSARGAPSVPSAPVARRTTVAVLGFQNLTGDPRASYLDHALGEMLPTEIAAGGRLLVVPSEGVDRLKRDLSISAARTLENDTLARVRRTVGADLVVSGSYLAPPAEARAGPGREIRIDLAVQETATGEILAAWSDRANEAALLDLIARLGERLRRELRAGDLSSVERAQVRAALPASPEAARLYADGIVRLRVFDAPEARNLLERAASADPRNAHIQWALASALSALGREGEALAAARRAFELAGGLPEAERWLIEARYRGMAREGAAEVALYRKLFRSYPDDLEYGLGLANAEVLAGRAAGVGATLAELRRLPAPAGRDPRIDVVEAEAAGATGDFARQRAAARRAAARGEELGARLLVARARFLEASALRQLGQLEAAGKSAEQARDLSAAAGNRAFEAVAWKEIGALRTLRGDLPGALEAFDRTVRIGREIGSDNQLSFGLNGRAIVLRRQGRLAESGRTFEEILVLQRKMGDRRGEAASLNGQATVLTEEGRLGQAERALERARGIFVDLGDKSAEGAVRVNECSLFAARGDVAAADEACRAARDLFRAIGETGGVVEADLGLARLDRLTGRFAEAAAALGKNGQEAERLGDDSLVRLARSERTLLALATGRPADAERLAREALQGEAAAGSSPADLANAGALLSLALADQGRSAEAAQALARARKAAPASENLDARLRGEQAEARLAPRLRAREILAAATHEAQKAGLAPWDLELRLARARLDLADKKPGSVKALEALVREARLKGLGGVVAETPGR
ncbi:MAG TPA: protein kinase [Thermoanaerobaculia bacterium]|nr:protein kinase [Thermoanaerobaculia bacterium]